SRNYGLYAKRRDRGDRRDNSLCGLSELCVDRGRPPEGGRYLTTTNGAATRVVAHVMAMLPPAPVALFSIVKVSCSTGIAIDAFCSRIFPTSRDESWRV